MKKMFLQNIVNTTAKILRIKTKLVRMKKINGGRANKSYISIPLWVKDYDTAYQIYYAVHEICHYKKGCNKHNILFKEIEDKMLALWNIEIERKKAYPKYIYYKGQFVENIPKW